MCGMFIWKIKRLGGDFALLYYYCVYEDLSENEEKLKSKTKKIKIRKRTHWP